MNHRSIIKAGIIAVIAIVILWSIVNISEYARHYHDSIIVWSLGAALGLANALSVYAFVIASSKQSRVPAGIGIGLFGGMSAVLQFLLYYSAGAPIEAALAFGCFGPVAEAVLSWLHAALSEEEAKQQREREEAAKLEAEQRRLEAEERQRKEAERQRREAEKAQRIAQKEAAQKPQKPQVLPAEIAPEQAPETGDNAAPKAAQPEMRDIALTAKQREILERRAAVARLTAKEIPQEDIAAQLRISVRTVQDDLAKLRATATTATNGASH